MEKRRIVLADIEQFYAGSLHKDIPEYRPIKIAHAIVTTGGSTLRMSGYPAIGPDGIIGKGDMRVQTLQALEYVKRTVEAGGARWDDIVHMTFFFTDRERFHREAVPARVEFFGKHSKRGALPCITSIGVSALMHPDMLIEVEATAVWEPKRTRALKSPAKRARPAARARPARPGARRR
ncbi:MAG: RidA family protein [Burkholderiales bacterium]|nr:RidA family protein [Burkholderiales bacterium]